MGRSSAAAQPIPPRATSRNAVVRDLMAEGLSPDEAERWCLTWETEARRQVLKRDGIYFWDAGRGWIDAQRSFGGRRR